MHNIHEAVTESAHETTPGAPPFPAQAQQSRSEIIDAEQLGIERTQSIRFAPDARVAGFLVSADIGPTSFGFPHGPDLPLGENFVTFEAIGIDTSGTYHLVRTAAGVAYAIVTYAPHARKRGLDHLKDHIVANPDHYAVRSLILNSPWPHSPEMIELLEAGWRRRLSSEQARQRLETLTAALAEVQRT